MTVGDPVLLSLFVYISVISHLHPLKRYLIFKLIGMGKGNKNTICLMLKYGETFYGCHTALNTSFIRKWGTRELEQKLPMSIRATYAIQYFTYVALNPVGFQHKSIAGRKIMLAGKAFAYHKKKKKKKKKNMYHYTSGLLDY